MLVITNSAKIEIHGCNSVGGTIVADNIVINLSQFLYEAGKTESVVIGHSTEANPNLPSTKRKKGVTDKEWKERANISQDYCHRERKVYNKGKVILTTKEGRITGEEIREALKIQVYDYYLFDFFSYLLFNKFSYCKKIYQKE